MDLRSSLNVRRACRALVNTPALTLASVVTLALGIGANTALFTIAYGVLLRPLPFRDPGRLVQLNAIRESRGGAAVDFPLAEFTDWATRARSFEALALFGLSEYSLSDGGEAEVVHGAVVTGQFFSVLGTHVIAGRALSAADDRIPSVVISHRLWTRRYHEDASAIGRNIVLNGQAYTIVGVAAPGFSFPAADVEVWAPAEFSATVAPPQWRMRGFRAFSIIGRLRDGVGLAQARQDVAGVARDLARSYPRFNQDTSATVVPLRDRLTERVRPALLLLFAAVTLVLLVACANVATLALARASTRAREVATRTALGATRGHLLGQFLTESALIAALGAAAGLAVAAAAVVILQRVGPSDVPRLDAIRLDGASLAFCGALGLGSALLFGTLPALHLSHGAPMDALRDGRSPSSRRTRRLHAWLVAGEVAAGVVLAIGAVLLARSLGAMMREDIGVADRGVFTLKLNLSSPSLADPVRQAAFLDRLTPMLALIPGVRSAGVTSHLPPNVSQMHTSVTAPAAVNGRAEEYGVEIVAADAGLFRTLGVPLLGGRLLSPSDTADAPRVVVVSASTARRLFRDADAIGRTIAIGPRDPSGRNRDPIIVGVVGDVRYSGFAAAPDGAVYMPYAQRPFRVMYVVVRGPGDFAATAADIRRGLAELDPTLAVSDVRRLDAVVSDAVAEPRFRTILMVLMALLAIVLAGAGVYGVLAYAVSERTAEIGVRIALGAEPARVMWMVMRQGIGMCAIGIGAGVAGAAALARLLGSFLYGIGRADLVSFLAGPLFLLAVTFLASYVPARRATRVGPLVALRRT